MKIYTKGIIPYDSLSDVAINSGENIFPKKIYNFIRYIY